MNDNIAKTVLRIVQDFCFESSAHILSDKFSLAITPKIVNAIEHNLLDLGKLKKIAKARNDYFVANEIDITTFSKGLFKRLNYELSFYSDCNFFDSVITFKRKMENGNFKAYPKENTSEDTLRSTLAIYIEQETFCEPRSAAGNNDITVPSEKVVIETKLWNGEEYYKSGFPELNEYLEKNGYNEGYYIIFNYNKNTNPVIKNNGEIFDTKYQDKLIHIIFVKMNAVCPSQIYKENKKRAAKA